MSIQSGADVHEADVNSDGDGDGDSMVPIALSQVGWLHQRQRQSFNILIAFYWPKLSQNSEFS